jgi:hypothetical protein
VMANSRNENLATLASRSSAVERREREGVRIEQTCRAVQLFDVPGKSSSTSPSSSTMRRPQPRVLSLISHSRLPSSSSPSSRAGFRPSFPKRKRPRPTTSSTVETLRTSVLSGLLGWSE